MKQSNLVHRSPVAINLRSTLAPLGWGATDPVFRLTTDGSAWWVTLTPDGPGTLQLQTRRAAGSVVGTSWGAGASWLLDRVPDLLGERDDPAGFDPTAAGSVGRVVAKAWGRHRRWRVPRTGRVFEACAAAVIEQKVTGREARHSWRVLLSRFGEPAPGPAPTGMFATPAPEVWRQLPEWDLRRAGVTPQRIHTLWTVAAAGKAVERTAELDPAEADRVLRALPGIGEWTSAKTRQRAHGDADAVSFGDFHVSADLCWWLTGERGDDEQLRELLRPFTGHRYRVQRLMELERAGAPRRGPRFSPPPHRLA